MCYVKYFLDVPCERGYTRKYGSDLGNKGSLRGVKYKGAEDTGVHEPTENECRIRCDRDPECKTYEYSPLKQKCVMRNVSDPRANSTGYEDFRWCSKSNIFTVFTLTTFQNRNNSQYWIVIDIILLCKDTCKTIDGPVVNETCKFPFIWREKEYYTCTNVGDYNDKRFWCPTEVGDIIADKDSKTWGYCSDDCPVHESKIKFLSYLINYSH